MGLRDALARALVPSVPPPVVMAAPTSTGAVKAVMGAGVYPMEHHVPTNYGSRNGPKWMRLAQTISRTTWVATAERVISGKLGTVGWHIEDASTEEEVLETTSGPYGEVRRLMERPNPRMTRRYLWWLTSRNLGVCGNAFWFLDQRQMSTGVPLAIYYINPARMTPVEDKRGNLVRWALDAENDYGWGKGIPIELDEVLHFVYDPPDDGHFGHGLVEAAMSKIEIVRTGDRFAIQTFSAGGKRGGIASPKYQEIIPDNVYQNVVDQFRAMSDADAVRRTVVSQGALDYTEVSSTPEELQLQAMLQAARDDILGIWGVPPSAIGIVAARGLNSGETQKYEEAALWQNAIEPRARAMWEVIQYGLIDRINPNWQLVLETPTFDDDEPLYKLADLAKTQPLTNRERRVLLGLDPFGDERDEDVWLPKGFVRIYPEEEPSEPAVPPAPVPPQLAAQTTPDQEDVRAAEKASLGGLRHTVERDVPARAASVATALRKLQRDVTARVRAKAGHLLRKPGDVAAVFPPGWDKDFAAVLEPIHADIARTVATRAKKSTAAKADESDFVDDVVEFVMQHGGERVTGINGTTRQYVMDAIADVVEEAAAEGLSIDEVADALTDRMGDLIAWSPERAELIARTETMLAYNAATLSSYSRLGVGQVVALDGDQDAECAARDGQVYSISDAYSISDHPNGTLDWVPVA